ncbi:MAG: thioredoxin family protein, partial [Anaerolineae bacterium]|nr:thioredoxin family protein [Anaerolineae bacterium]
MINLPDGWVVVCKEDCPTCTLIEPVLGYLAGQATPLTVYSQDNPAFPRTVSEVVDDTSLEVSYRLNIETVPTLIRVVDGRETERIVGWNRTQWQAFTGVDDLGEGLPEYRPGCGAKNVEPGIAERLAVRFGDAGLSARHIELAAL